MFNTCVHKCYRPIEKGDHHFGDEPWCKRYHCEVCEAFCEGCDDYAYDENKDHETPCANCDWCRTCEFDLSDVCCCADSPLCTDVVQARTFPWCAYFEEMTDDTRQQNEAIRKAWHI